MAADDGRYLQEIASLANGQTQRSQALRALNLPETPESAHTLLLQIGYWDDHHNPIRRAPVCPPPRPTCPCPICQMKNAAT
ncbi:MAG: hypothetical protein IPH82_13420 [Chloroflexi bacterium]|nr:hypothetical protein [Chloroflexota bacterium]